MQQAKKYYMFYPWGLTFLLLMGLSSCVSSGLNGINFSIGANINPIRELKPQSDNTVYIQGKVEKKVPLVKRQAYQINDSTGKIWVLTDQSGWKEGQQVVIKGKVNYQSIPLANREYGEIYLEEE